MDVWLISWLPSQGTQLHDHGGSSGAFTVLSGTLTEAVPCGFGGRLSIRDSVPSARLVSGVRSPLHPRRAQYVGRSAVSVHAYSPPLTSMTYYDVRDGDLTTITSVATDDPKLKADLQPARRAS